MPLLISRQPQLHCRGLSPNRIRNDDKAEYLLKWHGYDETFNSWEPEENLNCPKLLDKFKRKRKKEQRKKKKAKWGEEKVAQKLDDKNNEDSALSKVLELI